MDTIDFSAPADLFSCNNFDEIDSGPTAEAPYSDETVRLTVRHALEMLADDIDYRADALAMLAALPAERQMPVVKKPTRQFIDFWMMGKKVQMAC